jgi:hypothetical protein
MKKMQLQPQNVAAKKRRAKVRKPPITRIFTNRTRPYSCRFVKFVAKHHPRPQNEKDATAVKRSPSNTDGIFQLRRAKKKADLKRGQPFPTEIQL